MPKSSTAAHAANWQREVFGLALLALALLLALSLVPVAALGEGAIRYFPTGNIVGEFGNLIGRFAWPFFGIPALVIPLVPVVWGLAMFDRIGRGPAIRLTWLLGGIIVLVPLAIFAFARPLQADPVGAGWLGASLGGPLTTVLGWAGAGLLATFAFAMLCVATLGWNPMHAAGAGGISLWRATVAGAARAAGAIGRLRRPRLATDGPGLWQLEEGGEEDDSSDPLQDPDATVAEPKRSLIPGKRNGRSRKQPADAGLLAVDTGDPASADMPSSPLLTAPPPRDEAKNRRELDELGNVLIDKLATFRIDGKIVGMTSGPVVTQFEVSPAPGVKVSRIANLEADLALAMRAPSVRIVAPIPGKGAVGVEVPNPEPQMVYFREVVESAAFRGSKAQLPIALGEDISGRPYVTDLARTPHLLIAGATGSGKSVCVNTIITSLIFRHSPRSLRLLMIDPKMVELSMYNDLPHLRHPVVTDNTEAAGVLKWAVLEMERRYALLSANNVRNLADFNRRAESGQTMRRAEPEGEEGDPDRYIYDDGALPFIVLIIDELADLMMTVQGDVEKPLALLAQKARAIGIHLILATQRPSVNVITGLIKANFPSRIAFRVSSKVDSRTILDQNGADSLLGNGDMLFLPPGQSEPLRLQGAFISTEDTERLMQWYREQAELRRESGEAEGFAPSGEPDILSLVRESEQDEITDEAELALEDRDKLFREAAELCISNQGGSTSLLQRRLRIGYGRAARIIDQLHHAGVLGPPDGSKPRDVLMDHLQFEQISSD